MSKKRYIDTKLWSDGYVGKLDPVEKLLFLYLVTNERNNVAGIYELPRKYMSVETGIENSMLDNILSRFERDGKITTFEEWIRLTNSDKHQNLNNRNIQIGIENVLNSLKYEVKQGLKMTLEDSTKTLPRLSNNLDLDSDLDLDLDLDSNSNSNLDSITASPTAEAVSVKEQRKLDDPVGSECFRITRDKEIPIRNVATFKSYVKRLEKDVGREKALEYLTFIDTLYYQLPDDGYKPKINDGTEIYSKSQNIKSWVERMQLKQTQPVMAGGRPIL